MINKTLVADLDDDILTMALAVFLKNATIEIDSLNKAFTNKEYIDVARLAHKLRGSSISVGLEDFSKQAKLIEQEIKSNEAVADKEIQKLNSLFKQVQEHINN